MRLLRAIRAYFNGHREAHAYRIGDAVYMNPVHADRLFTQLQSAPAYLVSADAGVARAAFPALQQGLSIVATPYVPAYVETRGRAAFLAAWRAA